MLLVKVSKQEKDNQDKINVMDTVQDLKGDKLLDLEDCLKEDLKM